jgi:bifunctional non-homologous end joining protein LigD
MATKKKTTAPKKSKPAAKSAAKPAKKSTRASNASDTVDEQLARYRSMRDFHVTAEPTGGHKTKPRPTGALPFVIQKHAASHLHYDFRLGWNGVLKSWAVTKGPSYFPGDRRLAVQVEDHPMEYGGFEGIIPKGQYGGGTVMVWDQGTWTPQPGYENVDAGLRDGSLKFVMHGTKMKGKWTLVRMGGRAASESKPNWLLIKEHDDFERGKDDPCVTEDSPNSAVTGRTLEEIAQQEDHVWNSKETVKSGQAWYRNDQPAPPSSNAESPTHKSANGAPHTSVGRSPRSRTATTGGLKARPIPDDHLQSLPKEAQPTFLAPQLALEATNPPDADGWLHELKLDGYRIQARKDGAKVQMLTRKGLDWTHRIPAVAQAVAALPVAKLTLDGEVVVLGPDGTTNFADLQASFQEGANNPLTYFCFDLLHIDGRNPRDLGLRQRKAILEQILEGQTGIVRYSEHIDTGGEAMFHKACELHAEGIISKRAAAKYISGRSGDWLKSKCLREQEFVIGGYTYSSDGEDRIGSLLLGYYTAGKLIYAGRTGTGFTQKMRRKLKDQLHALEIDKVPFERPPAEARRGGAIWVKPQLVAQVRFATWTADNLVRQAAFLGLREDKAPAEVRREEPTVAPQPKASHRVAPALAAKASVSKSVQPKSVILSEGRSPKPKDLPTRQSNAKRPKHSVSDASASALPIRLTHPDKILDAETALTKRELAEFYWAVASRMLPHVAGRPLSLVRCPEGSGKPCFFQKHVNHMLPPGIGGIDVPNKKTGVLEPYITLDTPEALAGLAQMGVLEVHPWGSRNDDLEHPDRLIFDLDPDESLPWTVLTEAAAEVRSRLRKAGLTSFLKTTGGKGLHIVAPIEPKLSWTELKELAHNFVLAMERRNPALYLTKMTKSARAGKIYLDYLRNERGATAVAPYSPRARAGVSVSLPLAWKDLDLPERPTFRVKTFSDWKSRLSSDPWKNMLTLHQTIAVDAFPKS